MLGMACTILRANPSMVQTHPPTPLSTTRRWILNPPHKAKEVILQPEDELVVLTQRGRPLNPAAGTPFHSTKQYLAYVGAPLHRGQAREQGF